MTHFFRIRTLTGFVTLPRWSLRAVISSSSSERKAVSLNDGNDAQVGDGTTMMTFDSEHDVLDPAVVQLIQATAQVLGRLREALVQEGYTVQTLRLATSSFSEWLPVDDPKATHATLAALDALLSQLGLDFCALGDAQSIMDVELTVPLILQHSPRFSCSASLPDATRVDMARALAKCIWRTSQIGFYSGSDGGEDHLPSMDEPPPPHVRNGLGNFRFAVACSCPAYIPFFPVAKAPSAARHEPAEVVLLHHQHQTIRFAVGLENGAWLHHLMTTHGSSLAQIQDHWRPVMLEALLPVQQICQRVTSENFQGRMYPVEYMGMDTSWNPSLDLNGSIAQAMCLAQELPFHSSSSGNNDRSHDPALQNWGRPGLLAVAAQLTQVIQSLSPELQLIGYCGIMLPVCEDAGLVQLAEEKRLSYTQLLNLSSVCGVGIDTLPWPGVDLTTDNESEESELSSLDHLTALLLDVAALAHKWHKSLSCRILPAPGRQVGDYTDFDSPHMLTARILPFL